VTDKMAAARLDREQKRAQSRREAAQRVEYPAGQEPYGYYAGYSAYGRYQGPPRRHYRKRHHPSHPVSGPALVNQYPASLVRRSYSPRVAAVFQNTPAPLAVPYRQY
jgi:hypothetical protein